MLQCIRIFFSFFKERWTISEFTVKCGTLSFLAQTDRQRERFMHYDCRYRTPDSSITNPSSSSSSSHHSLTWECRLLFTDLLPFVFHVIDTPGYHKESPPPPPPPPRIGGFLKNKPPTWVEVGISKNGTHAWNAPFLWNDQHEHSIEYPWSQWGN